MSEIRFDDAEVALSSDGITYTAVEQVEGFEFDDGAETTRVDNADSTAAQPRHSKDAYSFSFDYVVDNPPGSGQDLIFTAKAGQKNGTYYYLRGRDATGSGQKQIYGQVVIESNRVTGRTGEYLRRTCTGKFITEPTIGDQ